VRSTWLVAIKFFGVTVQRSSRRKDGVSGAHTD
jgi:hypothetical protein